MIAVGSSKWLMRTCVIPRWIASSRSSGVVVSRVIDPMPDALMIPVKFVPVPSPL